MGEGATQTVDEIREVRDRLGDELEELEARLPRQARMAKKVAGLAIGGGIGGTLFWMGMRRVRSRRRKTAAAHAVQTVVQSLPGDWAEKVADRVKDRMEDSSWRQWLAAGAGMWLVFRLAELRQMRKMNQALIAGR
ncbi:MAG: hypothetical protein M3245_03330 [Actinomycetota bacterium]|nr:hypothetical protein [Actinomycetota bacterium]